MLVWRAFFISDFAPWKPNEPTGENTRRKSVCICMPLQWEILGIQDWTNLICLSNGVWERVAKIRIIKTKYFVLIDTHNRNVSNSCAYTLEQNMAVLNENETPLNKRDKDFRLYAVVQHFSPQIMLTERKWNQIAHTTHRWFSPCYNRIFFSSSKSPCSAL